MMEIRRSNESVIVYIDNSSVCEIREPMTDEEFNLFRDDWFYNKIYEVNIIGPGTWYTEADRSSYAVGGIIKA